MGNPIPYLKELAAILEIPETPLLLYACVDKLCRNQIGYRALFDTMDPELLAALRHTCTEMLVGTREALQASIDGLDAEDWAAVAAGNELATKVLTDDESLDEQRSRIKDLERLSEFLDQY